MNSTEGIVAVEIHGEDIPPFDEEHPEDFFADVTQMMVEEEISEELRRRIIRMVMVKSIEVGIALYEGWKKEDLEQLRQQD
jgi:hypothetical protein